MIDSRTAPYAALLLRLTLGLLFLAHASLKLFVFTPAGTAKFFGSVGLPNELAYVVIAAEVLAGIALVLGMRTRVVAIAAVPILLGGWEYPAFWTVALIVQALLGDGPYALRTSPADGFAGELSGAPSR